MLESCWLESCWLESCMRLESYSMLESSVILES